MPTLTPVLYDVLTSSEQDLILEVLNGLLTIKQDALEGVEVARVKGLPLMAGHRPFTAEDFGIPKVQALIEKFNAE